MIEIVIANNQICKVNDYFRSCHNFLITEALSSAAYVLSGEIETGSQHHFHMETQVNVLKRGNLVWL